jgi:hypothetical protein
MGCNNSKIAIQAVEPRKRRLASSQMIAQVSEQFNSPSNVVSIDKSDHREENHQIEQKQQSSTGQLLSQVEEPRLVRKSRFGPLPFLNPVAVNSANSEFERSKSPINQLNMKMTKHLRYDSIDVRATGKDLFDLIRKREDNGDNKDGRSEHENREDSISVGLPSLVGRIEIRKRVIPIALDPNDRTPPRSQSTNNYARSFFSSNREQNEIRKIKEESSKKSNPQEIGTSKPTKFSNVKDLEINEVGNRIRAFDAQPKKKSILKSSQEISSQLKGILKTKIVPGPFENEELSFSCKTPCDTALKPSLKGVRFTYKEDEVSEQEEGEPASIGLRKRAKTMKEISKPLPNPLNSIRSYLLLDELGEGSFAVVRKAIYKGDMSRYAVKIMEHKKIVSVLQRRPGRQGKLELLDLSKAIVANELEISKLLSMSPSSEHLCCVTHSFESEAEQTHYLFFNLAKHGSLLGSSHLKWLSSIDPRNNGYPSIAQIKEYFKCIAQGISHSTIV